MFQLIDYILGIVFIMVGMHGERDASDSTVFIGF